MKKAAKANHPERKYNIGLRVPGWLKNELLEAAEGQGLSLSEFVVFAAWQFARECRGVPAAGSAQFRIPGTEDVLRAYFSGEVLLQPCGRTDCDRTVVEVAGMEFCDSCNLRIG